MRGSRAAAITISAGVSLVKRVQGLVRVQLVKQANDVQVYVSAIHCISRTALSDLVAPGAATTLLARLVRSGRCCGPNLAGRSPTGASRTRLS